MIVVPVEEDSWYPQLEVISGEGVLCSGELESIVVPGVAVLVTSTRVSGERLVVSSVQVLELSALVVGLPLSMELSPSVDGMGWAVSVELLLWLSVDEVGRGTVT